MEITSRYDGVIETLHYEVGAMAQVGTPLCDIEVEGQDAPEAATQPAEPEAAAPKIAPTPTVPPPATVTPTPAPMPTVQSAAPAMTAAPSAPGVTAAAAGRKVLSTPAVRRLAKEHGIDLQHVPATGKGGRVVKSDLLNFIKMGHDERKQAEAAVASAPPATASDAVQGAAATTVSAATTGAPLPTKLSADEVVPIAGIKRIMVQSMNAALKVPHFVYGDEVEMGEAMALRRRLVESAAQQGLEGIKISMLPLMLKAASLALHRYPIVNATVAADESSLTLLREHNIGIAMDTPRGLLVPNVKGVQDKSIFEIAQDLTRLGELGAAGKLGEAELTGGTFTLSNIGSIGGTHMSPVIMVPQVAIGALGQVQKLPRFDDEGNVVEAHVMQCSWAGDHRVIDGAEMARFAQLFKAYLEDPTAMLAELR